MPDWLLPAGFAAHAIPVDAATTADLARLGDTLGAEGAAWLDATGYAARAGEVALVPGNDGRIARAVLGLGKGSDAPPLIAGRLPVALPAGDYRLGEGFADAAMATLAFGLGAYRYRRYRAAAPAELRRLACPEGVDRDEIEIIADAVYRVRDLVNTPANDLGPAELAAAAKALADRYGAGYSEIAGDALRDGNFNLILAVGGAAAPERAPRLIDLVWGDESAPCVTLVGKGVCFDTGGVDIKTAAGMLLMKKDMGGAANALGLAEMVIRSGLKVRLRVLIPAVENAIAGAAFRPGDIFTARNGVTVEIGNTDAEGRLVLADALSLAAEEKPDLLIDLATLTGAARVAVGPDLAPFYTEDDILAAELARAGDAVADPVWRLPLWRPYMSYLDSPVAAINNVGQSAFAGSILAALFLSRFVPDGIPWLHADIYAWTPKALPGKPEGGEAQAIRALFALLKDRYPA